MQAISHPESQPLPASLGSDLRHCFVDGVIDLYARDLSSAETSMQALCFNNFAFYTSSPAPTSRQQCTLALLCTDAILVQLETLGAPSSVLSNLFEVTKTQLHQNMVSLTHLTLIISVIF